MQKLLFLLLLPFFACQLNTKETVKEETKIKDSDVQFQDESKFCDESKFPDFKTNLQLSKEKISANLHAEIEKYAKKHIAKNCSDDEFNCDEMFLRHKRFYTSTKNISLFSYGYAFKDGNIEATSANLFVFGIIKNEKIILYETAEDLMGEIKLDLKGIELNEKNEKTIIWGEMYPYFDTDYGKFKCVISKGTVEYDFACQERH